MAFADYTDDSEGDQGVNAPISMDAEQWATPFDPPTRPLGKENRRKVNEFFVRVRRGGKRDGGKEGCGKDGGREGGGKEGREGRDKDEATEVLMGCAEDMKALWEDGTVRGVLEGWGVRLSQWSGL